MKDVIVQFADQHKDKPKEELSKVLDQEIEKFSNFMATMGDWKFNGPLNNPERALIKTYLVQKIKGVLD